MASTKDISAPRTTATANEQTFYYTNISPQMTSFNGGYWVTFEKLVQTWARSGQYDKLYVTKGGTMDDLLINFTGTISAADGRKPQTDANGLTRHGLACPHYYFMAILAQKGEDYQAIGFLVEHRDDYGSKLPPALSPLMPSALTNWRKRLGWTSSAMCRTRWKMRRKLPTKNRCGTGISPKQIPFRKKISNFAGKLTKKGIFMTHTRQEQMEAFGRFLDILDELREKCPWDRKQTNESLRPNTIEETYELCDALMRDDQSDICKELGDVLLHVAFYAKIGSEKGHFDIKDVCDRLCEKLIFRHPHVFGEVQANTAEQVTENWEQLKLKEKGGNKTVLSGVPSALPSLIKAYRIQDKARNVGFDWEEREQVWDKVKEEIQEFQVEVAHLDKEKAEAEFGDVLFSLVNAARLYKINPDNALERTNQKFIRRFNYLEAHTIREGKNLHDMTLAEMDRIWEEAKALERTEEKSKTPTPSSAR